MNKNSSIGIKIHDIHHGLVQSTGAIIESEYAFLKSLGAAIQIGTTIKDHEIIKDTKQFYAASGELKITRSMANDALEHLEALGFVRLKWVTGKREIKRIDILVPDNQKLYSDFGDYFKSESKSELALNTVLILDKLSAFPHKEREIINSLTVDIKEYDIIKDIGKAASLLGFYTSPIDSESIIYSPLYWDDNPKSIFELLRNHKSDAFLKAVDQVKGYPGIPDEKISEKVLIDAVTLGCLPTLSVTSSSGLKKFVFTPRLGVGKIEKNLLHKARVLLSCVRYGENFAGITMIRSPEMILDAFLGKGYLRPHSESLKQYEHARNLGLVKIIPSGSRFETHFIDNDQNKLVVKMAKEMLQFGETSKFEESEQTAKKILIPGSILHPTQTRTHILTEKNIEKSSSTIKRVNDLLRGIDS